MRELIDMELDAVSGGFQIAKGNGGIGSVINQHIGFGITQVAKNVSAGPGINTNVLLFAATNANSIGNGSSN
jgi:hypothetical protein